MRPRVEEVRIQGLGVIDEAVLELSPGFTVVTGETGAGKTMVVTSLGLLFGGRADPQRVRPGAEQATVEGTLVVDPAGRVAQQVEDVGGEIEDGELIISRTISAEGRSRAWLGGRTGPRRDAHQPRRRSRRRARPDRPAAAAPARPAARRPRPLRGRGAGQAAARLRAGLQTAQADRRRSWPSSPPRPGSEPRRPTCSGSGSRRSRRPTPSRARRPSSARRRSGSRTPTPSERGRDARTGPCSATRCPVSRPAGRHRAGRRGPHGRGGGARPRPGARRDRRPARRGRLPDLRRRHRAGRLRRVGRGRPGAARGRAGAPGRAHRRSPASTARTSAWCSPGPRRPRCASPSSTATTSASRSCAREHEELTARLTELAAELTTDPHGRRRAVRRRPSPRS